MIWGNGRAAGRVGSDFLAAIAGRVNVSPSRVGSKKSDPWTTLWQTSFIGIETVITITSHCEQKESARFNDETEG